MARADLGVPSLQADCAAGAGRRYGDPPLELAPRAAGDFQQTGPAWSKLDRRKRRAEKRAVRQQELGFSSQAYAMGIFSGTLELNTESSIASERSAVEPDSGEGSAPNVAVVGEVLGWDADCFFTAASLPQVAAELGH